MNIYIFWIIGDGLPPACQPLLAVAVETQIDANLGEKDNSIMSIDIVSLLLALYLHLQLHSPYPWSPEVLLLQLWFPALSWVQTLCMSPGGQW